ncbi:MAG: TIGR03085 family protein [Micropruina sp.]|nr:TIGR03085 family protein [Micropruina sp.]
MAFAPIEREHLCDVLDQADPEGATLCPPWRVHDLACHLWIRENDPSAAIGLVVKSLAGRTEARMQSLRAEMSYGALVGLLRQGPPKHSLFALPAADEQANPMEYFTHAEDIRRAPDSTFERRQVSPEFQDYLWRRLPGVARLTFRRSTIGLVLERPNGKLIQLRPGASIVTLIGEPSELLLYAYGRREVAAVELIGEPDSVLRLEQVDLGI